MRSESKVFRGHVQVISPWNEKHTIGNQPIIVSNPPYSTSMGYAFEKKRGAMPNIADI